jgi:serine/threonine protein kinase
VINIYDYDVARGVPYIVMEYFNGPNIKQQLRLAPELVVEHLDDVIHASLRGLGVMHAADWVHRDVKPDNFLMNDEGDVRLIDFSIAEKIKRGLGKLLSGKSKVQGTMSYIPPEQIRGENVDGRADIYSLGCMFFEMVSGKMPYTGVNPNELLNKHLKAPIPSLISVNDSVTPEFAQLVARMMAKRADERPASTGDIETELDAIRVFRRGA